MPRGHSAGRFIEYTHGIDTEAGLRVNNPAYALRTAQVAVADSSDEASSAESDVPLSILRLVAQRHGDSTIQRPYSIYSDTDEAEEQVVSGKLASLPIGGLEEDVPAYTEYMSDNVPMDELFVDEGAEDEESGDKEPEDATHTILFADLDVERAEDHSDSLSDSDDDAYNAAAPTSNEGRVSGDLRLSPSNHSFSPANVTHSRPTDRPHIFLLALGLLFEITRGSRENYRLTREVLQLAFTIIGQRAGQEEDQVRLPFKLNTLKKLVRGYLPLLALKRMKISVTMPKIASLPAGQKTSQRRNTTTRQQFMYWYDPVELSRAILSTDLRMHLGLGIWVEQPTEF